MSDFETENIRNICILAHVDHGKTTLADHLIAATGGGLIHPKLAGKLRFMDYLDEEQRRAITMKSSSIGLHYKEYSINLIDSPGHMDFCSEVSTAARLSDGALVLVDAVEGVHIQTHAVLRQSWIEKLTPCLVLNKIDRLICELKLSPMEAYTRLLRIVHEVNSIMSTYKSEKYLSDVDSLLAGPSDELGDENLEFIEDDEEDTFQPQKGNVAFVCALDGWGFSICEFAEFYASKLGASSAALRKALWGPRYFIPKTKMIVGKKGVEGVSKARPMFVQFVLEPLWQVYQSAIEPDGNKGLLEKVIKSFNLNVPPRELQNKDPKFVLQAVLSRWLPLSDAILSMVVKCMPDPISAQSFRVSRLLPEREALHDVDSSIIDDAHLVRKSVEICDSNPEAPLVAFVSKMFAVPTKMLPSRGPSGDILNSHIDENGSESEECFLAFARVFSGVLCAGQRVFVLSALYDPLKGESMQKHVQEAELQSLYLMMGQGLKPVASVKAGNVVAIRGLGQHILKSATLSSTRNSWPFSSMAFQVSPTLRVAVEPSDPADMTALLRGLRLLNRADPFVEVTVSSRGENVLSAAGEVHLERCIKDLKDRFAKVSLEVSPPLVSYKETIEGHASNALENLNSLSRTSDYVEKVTPNGRCVVRVQVMKLPPALTKVLDESADILGDIIGGKLSQSNRDVKAQKTSIIQEDNPVEVLKKRIMDAVESEISSWNDNDKDRAEKYKKKWQKFVKNIWALGPRHVGPNILFTPDLKKKSDDFSVLIGGSPHVSEKLGLLDDSSDNDMVGDTTVEGTRGLYMKAETLQNSVVTGFQLATDAGPLCEEPMWGVAFVVEVSISPPAEQSGESESIQQFERDVIFTGQVMAAVKDACRAALLQNKPRLVEAMYFCELNTPTEYLGAMYAVLNRKRARVLKEEMQEGSPLFTVHAYVPVSESFGFADELRRWTSGAASALLVLSHWEELSEDPFFVPKTEEEIEEFGDGASVLPNTARKLIDAVRRQKGLPVEEKVVQHATKQRTRARKVAAPDHSSGTNNGGRISLAFRLIPQGNAILDCSPIAAAGHVIPQSYVPISVSQFMDDLSAEEDVMCSQPDNNYVARSNLTKEPSLRSVLSDPLSGAFLDDAVFFSCGHSFGGLMLKRVFEMSRCTLCNAQIEPGSSIPNFALRAAAAAVKQEDDRRLFHNAALRKRRKEMGDQTDHIKRSSRENGDVTADDSLLRGVQYPFSVNEKVVIRGNRRTPEKFVGKEAIITSQCLNGWYLLKIIGSGENVRLQYRSLRKISISQATMNDERSASMQMQNHNSEKS